MIGMIILYQDDRHLSRPFFKNAVLLQEIYFILSYSFSL